MPTSPRVALASRGDLLAASTAIRLPRSPRLDAATWSGAWAAGRMLSPGAAVAAALSPAAEHEPDTVPAATVDTPSEPYPEGLTAREVDVLRLVAQGMTDLKIAERLFVSRHTVHTHLRSIYGKLGVSTRAAATRFAVQHGLA